MKKTIVATVMAAVLAIPAMAQTSVPSRMAVINVQKVLAESSAGKAAFEKLRKMQDERTARLKRLDDEIRALDTDLTQKRMSLSAEKVAEKTQEISDKRIALQRQAQDAERELQTARDKELQAMEEKISPIIEEIGKEMGFAVIFNKFEAGLVYASPAIDITDTVIKRFNDVTAKAPAGSK